MFGELWKTDRKVKIVERDIDIIAVDGKTEKRDQVIYKRVQIKVQTRCSGRSPYTYKNPFIRKKDAGVERETEREIEREGYMMRKG